MRELGDRSQETEDRRQKKIMITIRLRLRSAVIGLPSAWLFGS